MNGGDRCMAGLLEEIRDICIENNIPPEVEKRLYLSALEYVINVGTFYTGLMTPTYDGVNDIIELYKQHVERIVDMDDIEEIREYIFSKEPICKEVVYYG